MENFLAPLRPQLLSLFRIMTGLLIFQFGVAKIFKFPTVPMFAGIPPLSFTKLPNMYQVAGTLELVLGALLVIGLFSRLSAFVLSGLMACAFFIGHVFKGADPVFLPLLNGGTLAATFCFACLYLAAAGPGPWSVDAAMRGKA